MVQLIASDGIPRTLSPGLKQLSIEICKTNHIVYLISAKQMAKSLHVSLSWWVALISASQDRARWPDQTQLHIVNVCFPDICNVHSRDSTALSLKSGLKSYLPLGQSVALTWFCMEENKKIGSEIKKLYKDKLEETLQFHMVGTVELKSWYIRNLQSSAVLFWQRTMPL